MCPNFISEANTKRSNWDSNSFYSQLRILNGDWKKIFPVCLRYWEKAYSFPIRFEILRTLIEVISFFEFSPKRKAPDEAEFNMRE